MKAFASLLYPRLTASCLIALTMLGGIVPSTSAAPPQKRQTAAQQQNGLKKLGDFLFGSSRRPARLQLQTSQPVSKRSLPQAPQGETLYAAAAAPETATAPRPEISISAEGRTRLVMPVLPGGYPLEPTAAPTSRELGPDPALDAATATANTATEPAPVVLPGPIPDHPEYGLRVPGRRGYVRPPGANADPTYVLDVRDHSPGDKVRDPRTGSVFLVPPY